MTATGDRFFLDTNVVLYWAASAEPEKQLAASQWINAVWFAEVGRVSFQVIVEFYSNAIRKYRASPAAARSAAEVMLRWKPEPPGAEQIQRAWHWCDSTSINFWDALIVASAEQSGCRWLLSEDFQAGQRFGGVTVVNPFESRPAEFGLA